VLYPYLPVCRWKAQTNQVRDGHLWTVLLDPSIVGHFGSDLFVDRIRRFWIANLVRHWAAENLSRNSISFICDLHVDTEVGLAAIQVDGLYIPYTVCCYADQGVVRQSSEFRTVAAIVDGIAGSPWYSGKACAAHLSTLPNILQGQTLSRRENQRHAATRYCCWAWR